MSELQASQGSPEGVLGAMRRLEEVGPFPRSTILPNTGGFIIPLFSLVGLKYLKSMIVKSFISLSFRVGFLVSLGLARSVVSFFTVLSWEIFF